MQDDDRTSDLEVTVGRILRTGIVASSVCLAAGLVFALAGRDTGTMALLKAGIGILLATPAARVAAAAVDYARHRDWLFAALVLIVLAELLASVIAAAAGRG